jgi:hypothetical protein
MTVGIEFMMMEMIRSLCLILVGHQVVFLLRVLKVLVGVREEGSGVGGIQSPLLLPVLVASSTKGRI